LTTFVRSDVPRMKRRCEKVVKKEMGDEGDEVCNYRFDRNTNPRALHPTHFGGSTHPLPSIFRSKSHIGGDGFPNHTLPKKSESWTEHQRQPYLSIQEGHFTTAPHICSTDLRTLSSCITYIQYAGFGIRYPFCSVKSSSMQRYCKGRILAWGVGLRCKGRERWGDGYVVDFH